MCSHKKYHQLMFSYQDLVCLICLISRHFRMSKNRLFMELAGKLRGPANTTPAVFFAPWSQLSEVFPACWTCKGKREDQRRGGRGERENIWYGREGWGNGEGWKCKKHRGEFDEMRHTLYVYCCCFQPLGRILFSPLFLASAQLFHSFPENCH